MSKSIATDHEGIVTAVDPRQRNARVRIDAQQSGCGGCAASAFCGVGKGQDIEVTLSGVPVTPGQRVTVAVAQRTHRLAVLLMLVVPWLVLVLTVMLLNRFTEVGEGLSVLAGFGATALAYILISRIASRVSRQVTFTLKN